MAKKKNKYKFSTNRPETSEFWYDIGAGGYLQAEDFSKDKDTIKAIKDAIELMKLCEERCELN